MQANLFADSEKSPQRDDNHDLTMTPSERTDLERLLRECASAARRWATAAEESRDVVGLADQAQFLTHWGIQGGGDIALESAERLAGRAVELLALHAWPPHWIGGFCGITWSLRDSCFAPARDPNFSEAIDDALQDLLNEETWRGNYDLIVGLAGFGCYALEHPVVERGESLVRGVIRHLAAVANESAEGLSWRTAPELIPQHQRSHFPNGYHNLGLAHGVPGVIGFLARCSEENVAREQAQELLEPALRWLLAQKRPDGAEAGFHFPNFVESVEQSRPLAWCYGDLGVSLAMFRAGQALDSKSLCRLALEVAADSARPEFDPQTVVDAGLCHGAAGAALIFHRFWQVSADTRFLAARNRWLKRILALVDPNFVDSAGIYSVQGVGAQKSARASFNRLTGLAGVGLALMTCLGGLDTNWDAPLLTDLHFRKGGL